MITAKEATPRDFQELAPIDTTYLYRDELEFDHWPATPFETEPPSEATLTEETVLAGRPGNLTLF